MSAIAEILSMIEEIKRNPARRLMAKEQIEIIEFNHRDDSQGLP